MTSCPEALRIFEFEKKIKNSELRFGLGRFLVSPRRDQLGSTKCASRLLKKLCLSLLMSKNLKLKKVIKSFVPEPKKKFVNVSCFWIPYVYFTYSYLGRIFGRGYITLTALFLLVWFGFIANQPL